MKLNDSGLPQPGRELDAAVWGMLGHEVLCYAPSDRRWYDAGEKCEDPLQQPWYRIDGELEIVPFVSTSAAYHHVLEAKRQERSFSVYVFDDHVWVSVQDSDRGLVAEAGSKYNGEFVEQAIAHAVCAAVYLAEKGEDNAGAG